MDTVSSFKYCIPLTNSKRAHLKYCLLFLFIFLFPNYRTTCKYMYVEIVVSFIGLTLQVLTTGPDSTHTLAQRWANVVRFVGPMLAFNVGPTL